MRFHNVDYINECSQQKHCAMLCVQSLRAMINTDMTYLLTYLLTDSRCLELTFVQYITLVNLLCNMCCVFMLMPKICICCLNTYYRLKHCSSQQTVNVSPVTFSTYARYADLLYSCNVTRSYSQQVAV